MHILLQFYVIFMIVVKSFHLLLFAKQIRFDRRSFVMQSCWEKACPLLQVLSSAVTSAENAGRLIRRTRGQDMDILEKGYRDLQTKADRFSEISIVSSLRMKFQTNLRIIAEEGLTVDSDVPASFIESGVCNDVLALEDELDAQLKNASINEASFTVWIDPLDGTYEFAHGLLSHATIMIGISLSAKPVAGVIHQPFVSDVVDTLDDVGRTVWAVKSVDRIFGDLKVKPPLNDKRIVVTTRSHGNPNLEKILEILQPTEVIRVGGAGHKVLMLIEGDAHAYVFPGSGTKKWDTCAAECILSAAGGRMTDLCGNEIDYSNDVNVNNLQGILATAPTVDHEKYASFSNQNL
ncbi:3'(2'),5'-bisphosphate nucleotidase 1 [Trichinella papuae]|uniref:3'(2'),5'-bisphosphate nucleotidase 1 n=2 Tax=Trichinella papuae TaxID=268474 RepID=A0A0V1MPD7_9BILA|nr:3'(2'),5'-bisphosphate nucleotidase 1 [Trichinella papuae]